VSETHNINTDINLTVMHVMAGADNGGAEMAYIDMCLAMHEAGVKVIAVCRKNGTRNPILKKAGVELYELPFGGIFDFRTSASLKKLIIKCKPDIVQTWMSRAAAKLPSKPNIGKNLTYIARLGGYYNIPKYYKRCDYFVGVTPDLCKHIKESGIDESRIMQINNFAETESDTQPIDRESVNTPNSAFVFLTLARLHEAKAIDTLLETFTHLPPECYLWIAGSGPDEEDLKTLCHDLGLEARVRFLGWRTDRAALLAASDAVVFPSRYEPFGSTFVQAWVAQRPLVTTASQGPSQYVIDGQDALLVEIDNVDALAKAMNEVFKNEELQRQLVKNGYQRYRNEFEKGSITRQYLDFYAKTLEKA
jgi:glycosyltransferase involved in cell wall biosynthesis